MEEETRDVNEQRREFTERRRSIIGATDSAKILGLSRHGTALTVYKDKVEEPADGEMSLPAWLGLKLQNTVAELYAAKTGVRVRADNLTHRLRPPLDYIGCHLDFRVLGNPKLLVECKTRAFQSGWGDDGSDKVPVEVWVQVQHEMMVTGAERCDVAVLFGHHTFHVYPILRDEKFIAGLMASLVEFREQHWLPGIPPLPTGHALDTEAVKADNPEHDEQIKAATPEQTEFILRRYKIARVNAAQAALAKVEAENKIRDWIGPNAGITGPGFTITWKRSKDSKEVHWDQVAASYRKSLIEKGDDVAILDAIESIYTTEKPGTRRMNYQFSDEEEDDAIPAT